MHLTLHPLRQTFSDGFDLLRKRKIFLGYGLVAGLGAALFEGGQDVLHAESSTFFWMDLQTVGPILLGQAALEWATLLHQAHPVWPMCLLTPLWLPVMLAQLTRQPYRAGLRKRLSGSDLAFLLVLWFASLIWAVAEIYALTSTLPEALMRFKLGLRLVMMALHTAIVQIWLFRLTALWLHPRRGHTQPDWLRAWWETIGRWHLISLLTVFNLIWLNLRLLSELDGDILHFALLVEILTVFSMFPMAIAVVPAGRDGLTTGGLALRLLGRSWLSVLGLTVTGITFLTLVLFSSDLIQTLYQPAFATGLAHDFFRAFVLAFLRNWLFLSAALLLMRDLDSMAKLSSNPA